MFCSHGSNPVLFFLKRIFLFSILSSQALCHLVTELMLTKCPVIRCRAVYNGKYFNTFNFIDFSYCLYMAQLYINKVAFFTNREALFGKNVNVNKMSCFFVFATSKCTLCVHVKTY